MNDPVLLLAKPDRWSDDAERLARLLFGDRLVVARGRVGDPFPDLGTAPRFAVLLSFLSPWIVPAALLERAGVALNFHPGSRDYPGTGCYNFALYEGAALYGPVCHHMAATVDTGAIVDERLFAVAPAETVETLKFRTMVAMLALFHDIASRLAAGQPLPEAAGSWSRRPFTRREMNALCRIAPDMPAQEIRRRVRAMTYPGSPGPTVELAGVQFASPVPAREPLA
ncbi:MAG: hypothetical protein HQL41_09290 [Alphaproteobacteria bacterium]|nr:hypothetical protein [Alphaproteobacteria bacterium]